MNHGSLFSGIGGFDLAAEWMGWSNLFHCENNPYCQKILKQHWPGATLYGDIKATDFTIWRGKIDILSGGFPCQPYSVAGKRKGDQDDRHLWPEMLRAIRECKPRWVVGENVRGLISWNGGLVFDQVQSDLETEGFEVLPFLLPACAVNAPHRRERIWFVAHSNSNTEPACPSHENKRQRELGSTTNTPLLRERPGAKSESGHDKNWVIMAGAEQGGDSNDNGAGGIITNPDHINGRFGTSGKNGQKINNYSKSNATDPDSDIGCEGRLHQAGPEKTERHAGSLSTWDGGGTWENFPTVAPVCRRDDGISNRVDRIKALGNAVVPQVVYHIFKAIEAME